MSKSLKRVAAALDAAGIASRIIEFPSETRTAQQAAEAAGCALDQIVKSIIYAGRNTGHVALFLTAGGNRVDDARASDLAGEPLGRADADLVRSETGFAIGGVAPVGHITPVRTWIDPRLSAFPLVWAAAGTPRHIFSIAPDALIRVTGGMVADFTAVA